MNYEELKTLMKSCRESRDETVKMNRKKLMDILQEVMWEGGPRQPGCIGTVCSVRRRIPDLSGTAAEIWMYDFPMACILLEEY